MFYSFWCTKPLYEDIIPEVFSLVINVRTKKEYNIPPVWILCYWRAAVLTTEWVSIPVLAEWPRDVTWPLLLTENSWKLFAFRKMEYCVTYWLLSNIYVSILTWIVCTRLLLWENSMLSINMKGNRPLGFASRSIAFILMLCILFSHNRSLWHTIY